MNKRVVIMRGASGAGKSTYIRNHLPGAYVCSADHFFICSDGVYSFDPSKLGEAHNTCYYKFLCALSDWRNLIVVDNTNTQLFEFYGYVQLAKAYGYAVEVVRLDTPVHVAAARNIHGVDFTTVETMASRFQDIPKFLGLSEKIVKGA